MTIKKVIDANPTNAGSAVGFVTPLGTIYHTNAKFQDPIKQFGEFSGGDESVSYVPLSGNVGLRSIVPAIVGRQITVTEFTLSASAATVASIMSSGTLGIQLLSGPFALAANTSMVGTAFRSRVGEAIILSNSAGTIGGNLTYKVE